MAEPQSVKIHETCRVAPTIGQPNLASPKSLPHTFFDLLWLRFKPVERLYFYQTSPSKSETPFYDFIVPRLKRSLSLTLQHYLPLAGNLVWPKNSHRPIIQYLEGNGVSLTVAESNMDFHRLSSKNEFREATECHHLVPHLEVSEERASVIALQITLFPNSGFCIGITSHHAVMDGKTSTSFVKSWAHMCNTNVGADDSLPPELTPFYDRAVIKDPADLETNYSSHLQNHGGPNNRSLMLWEAKIQPQGLVRATFELSREDIQKLKNSVSAHQNSKQSPSQSHRVSTFSVVYGYTVVCMQRAAETRKEKYVMAFAVDARPRLEPQVPSTYFGNCVAGCAAVLETEKLLGEDGVVLAVEGISESIRGIDENGVLKGAETWPAFVTSASETNSSQGNEAVIGIAGSPRFEVYSTDFGYGRPKNVEVTSIDRSGAISLAETRDGNGGVQIGLVLEPQHMKAFASLFAQLLHQLSHSR